MSNFAESSNPGVTIISQSPTVVQIQNTSLGRISVGIGDAFTSMIQKVSLNSIVEFKVGVGQPMTDGQTTYTNTNIPTGAIPIVFIDGIRLSYINNGGRYITYNVSSKTITFVGGVLNDEIVSIYA
jgi:hypothetical protein